MLLEITKLLLASVAICQCVRWYCGDSAKTVLTLISMWRILGRSEDVYFFIVSYFLSPRSFPPVVFVVSSISTVLDLF